MRLQPSMALLWPGRVRRNNSIIALIWCMLSAIVMIDIILDYHFEWKYYRYSTVYQSGLRAGGIQIKEITIWMRSKIWILTTKISPLNQNIPGSVNPPWLPLLKISTNVQLKFQKWTVWCLTMWQCVCGQWHSSQYQHMGESCCLLIKCQMSNT